MNTIDLHKPQHDSIDNTHHTSCSQPHYNVKLLGDNHYAISVAGSPEIEQHYQLEKSILTMFGNKSVHYAKQCC